MHWQTLNNNNIKISSSYMLDYVIGRYKSCEAITARYIESIKTF